MSLIFLNLSGEEVIKIIQECLPKSEGIIMNAREEWTQEGIKKGMQQGAQYKTVEIAQSMLLRGLSDQLVQEITQLSKRQVWVFPTKSLVYETVLSRI